MDLNLLRQIFSPLAAGAAITGTQGLAPIGAAGSALPIMAQGSQPPQAPPVGPGGGLPTMAGGQGSQPSPNVPAINDPPGNVLAVINPYLAAAAKANNADSNSLLSKLMDGARSGGLTADGVGRSKWGAFSAGFASGMNARTKQRDALAAARTTRADKDRDFALKQQDVQNKGAYYKGMLGLKNRVQDWQETPDVPGTTPATSDIQLQNARIRWRTQRARELGLSFKPDPFATPADLQKRAASLAQLDKEEADPKHIWNRQRPTGPTTGPNAVPAAAPPAAAPAPAGSVPAAPLDTNGAGQPQANATATAPPPPTGAPKPYVGDKPPTGYENARRAPDGNWYVPNPNQPNSWMRVDQ